MIVEEWREARWQLLAITVLVLSVPYTTPLETTAKEAVGDGVQVAVFELYEMYAWGGVPLAVLAALLGAGLISSEVERGSIFLLLSKPAGRGRILLTKYAVSTATLLLAAVIGHVLLLAIAAKSYPLEEVSAPGVILATVLLWLGSLFVLSVALFFSVLIKNVLGTFAATALTVYLIFVWVPTFLVSLLPRGVRNRTGYDPTMPEFEQPSLSWVLVDRLSLQTYWTNDGLYAGETFAVMDILVCLIAAAVPFITALWLFDRKNY